MRTTSREAAQLSDLLPICRRLPLVMVDQLIGVTRVMSHAGEHVSHARLAAALHFDDEQTAGVLEFLSSLGLVEVSDHDAALSEDGKRIASARIAARPRLFRELAIRLPIMREVLAALTREPTRSLPRGILLEALGAQSCALEANRVFDHVIAWGRYAGLFAYDHQTGQVSLRHLPDVAPVGLGRRCAT
jgi:NitT/TauT family transport system ATP-binding protein